MVAVLGVTTILGAFSDIVSGRGYTARCQKLRLFKRLAVGAVSNRTDIPTFVGAISRSRLAGAA